MFNLKSRLGLNVNKQNVARNAFDACFLHCSSMKSSKSLHINAASIAQMLSVLHAVGFSALTEETTRRARKLADELFFVGLAAIKNLLALAIARANNRPILVKTRPTRVRF